MNTFLQVHWAAQIVSSVGRTLVASRADDSHTSFTWIGGALAGEPIEDGRRTVLRVRDLTIVIGEVAFPLRGKTLDQGYTFAEAALGRTLVRPTYDLPDHEVARGAVFDPEENELALLASMFDGAAEVLERFRATRAEAGPVLLWPHHFDIATLLDLGNGRFVGAGFVPGDAQYPEPYWYVNVWPERDRASLPPLARGFWNPSGWSGAVFVSSDAPEGEMFVKEAAAILTG